MAKLRDIEPQWNIPYPCRFANHGSRLDTDRLRLAIATMARPALGFDREWRGHDAGLPTRTLVSLSSAMITLSALSLAARNVS